MPTTFLSNLCGSAGRAKFSCKLLDFLQGGVSRPIGKHADHRVPRIKRGQGSRSGGCRPYTHYLPHFCQMCAVVQEEQNFHVNYSIPCLQGSVSRPIGKHADHRVPRIKRGQWSRSGGCRPYTHYLPHFCQICAVVQDEQNFHINYSISCKEAFRALSVSTLTIAYHV